MQENPPLSITTHAGGCYMLWMWGKIRLRNYHLRLGIICCRGCLVLDWSLQNGGSFWMTRSIGAIETVVSSGRRVTLVWTKLVPEGYEVMESSSCLNTWCHPVRVNFLLVQMPRSFACQSLWKRSRKSGVGRRLFRLFACGHRKILILNMGHLNWLGDRAAGWQLACWSVNFLEIYKWRLFRSWCHDDWDRVAATIDIVPPRLTEDFEMWTDFSGI